MSKIIKKRIIISMIITLIVCISGFGLYEFNKIHTYNNLISSANKDMNSEDYKKAISEFTQSLKYKSDGNIKKRITLAQKLDKMKIAYNNGIKLCKDKKYIEAIEQFKKVTGDDTKLYSNAQKQIQDCKNKYIAQNMQLANDAYKNKKYDDANSYLDKILKINTNDSEAKNLRDQITKAQQNNNSNNKTNSNIANASSQQTTGHLDDWILGQAQWTASNKGNISNSNQNNQTQAIQSNSSTQKSAGQQDNKAKDTQLALLQLQLQKDQQTLQKAQQQLAFAKDNTDVRMMTDDGWKWVADSQAVNAAQEKINDAQYAVNQDEILIKGLQ